MALYSYRKVYYTPRKRAITYVSYGSLIIGSLLLFWSFYPILSFEIYARLFIQSNIQTPIPRTQVASAVAQANSVLGAADAFSSNLRDFTDVKLWFPDKPQGNEETRVPLKEYTLSIPKINIEDARVTVAGEDLTQSLVQYLAETQPGEYGNVVIFGHSTLPQLYNSKDYKTIFTYLASLEKGDKVIAKVEGVSYVYEVYDIFIVKPEQVSVLEQRKDGAFLTLITCTPPGTYWNRLVIRAKLTTLPQ